MKTISSTMWSLPFQLATVGFDRDLGDEQSHFLRHTYSEWSIHQAELVGCGGRE